jgi:hypothetical protein
MRRLLSLIVAVAACDAASVHAQQSPLQQIPAKTAIVVQVRGFDRSLERAKSTIKAAIPDFAALVIGQLETSVSNTLSGREWKALAKDGPLFIVFPEVPTGEDDPELVLIAHVTNYVQFRDAFLKDEEKKELKADKGGYEVTKIEEKTTYIINRDDYVVLTPSEKALKVYLDKKTEPLSSRLNSALATKLLDSDLSVYVDMKALRKQHGDKLDQAKGAVDQVIQLAQATGNVDKSQIESAKKLYEGLFQLAEDADAVVAAVDFRPEGFLLRVHSEVAEKAKTNVFLRDAASAPFAGLGKLPAGQLIYTASAPNGDLLKGLGASMFMGLGGESKENKEYADAASKLAAVASGPQFGSSDYPAAGVQVTECKDAASAVATALKMYEAMPENSSFTGIAVKGKPEIKTDAQKLRGFSLHQIHMNWDFDRIVERFPEELRDKTKETMKTALGSETHLWIGTDGKSFVQVTAADWDSAKKMLEAYLDGKSPISKEAGYEVTRQQLPAEGSTLMLVDAGRMAYFLGQYLSEVLKNVPGFPGGNLGQAKKPEGKPVYIGLAIALKPQHGSLDLFVPAEGVKQIVETLAPLLGGLAEE